MNADAAAQPWWEQVANGIRWVVFIPGAIVGGMIAGFLALLIIGGNLWLMGHRFDAPFALLAGAAVVGYTTVLCATKIAPNPDKRIPAIVMAIVMFMLYGVAMLGSILTKDWFQIAQWIAGVTATAVALHHQYNVSK